MYAKVYRQIFDSSIAEDYKVRLVFEDLLKLCDRNGVVDMTHGAISRVTNVPLEMVKKGIFKLEQPDPHSRTKDHEGRRIVRLDKERDWGWWIVNYEYYRSLGSEEQRRERTTERVQKFRDSKKLDELFPNVTNGNALKHKANAVPFTSAVTFAVAFKEKTRWFCDAWRQSQIEDLKRRTYVKRSDIKLVGEMITQGMDEKELIATARASWKVPVNGSFSWCANAKELTYFLNHYDNIREQVNNGGGTKRPEKNQLAEKIPLRMI